MTEPKSPKSQAKEIELLQARGWIEEQHARDIRRWREPKTRALYSLRDAISLLVSYGSNQTIKRI